MKQRGPLMVLELTTDRYPPITSQTRYPLRHAVTYSIQYEVQNASYDAFKLRHI